MPIVAKRLLQRETPPAVAIARPEIQPRARVRCPAPPAAPTLTAVPPPPLAPPAAAPSTGDDYEVGYRKPPKHTQFKKGQSGNTKGRPKGAKGLKTIARELLSEKVTVRTAAGSKRMRKIEAMVHKVMEKAFNGDMRAIQALLQLYASSVPDEPLLNAVLANAPEIPTDEHDEAIMKAFEQTLRQRIEEGSS